MAASPVFYPTPVVGRARIATANGNRDGSGTLGTVLTCTADTRIERIDIVATGTTTAGMVRLFISDATNIRAWKEVVVAAITVAAGVAAFSAIVDGSDPANVLILPNTWILLAGTHNAEQFDVTAWGFKA